MLSLASRRTAASLLGHSLAPRSLTAASACSFSSSSSSSQEDARILAQSQAPPQQQQQQQDKGFLGNFMDKLSIKKQQHRIQLGEEMFQAAFRQANDA